MKQRLVFSFLIIACISLSSCSNESSNSSEPKILEEINLVCEGESTRKFDYEWKSTEPEKKVYRFVRTEEESYLYGYGVGPNPKYYAVNIDEEKISLTYQTQEDEEGHSYYNSIVINRFTGDVKDWDVIDGYGNSETIFEGSCKPQDQKF